MNLLSFKSLSLLTGVFVAAHGFGCSPSPPNSDAGAGDAGVVAPDVAEPDPCDNVIDLSENEAPFETLTGFSGSEDFAFDGEGHLVSLDRNGNLTKQQIGGSAQLIAPAIGEETAGIRLLANGDAILANVGEGSLQRITPEGAKSTLLSGIAYPNGVEVDLDGTVFVAEHDAGRVREVNPDTGEFEIIADGLFNPNGLSFSPDYQTLYIGSFGGGTVHSITREGEGWSEKVLFSQVTEPTVDSTCENEGDPCFTQEGLPGACNAELECAEQEPTTCTTLGENCVSDTLNASTCVNDVNGALACPSVNAAFITACDGLSAGGACTVGNTSGTCEASSGEDFNEFGGEFLVCFTDAGFSACAALEDGEACTEQGQTGVCYTEPGFGSFCVPGYFVDEEACAGLAVGDRCSSGGTAGRCDAGFNWGTTFDICLPDGFGGFGRQSGGLDGVNTDSCGNVYITEFTTGKIYRLPEDGSTVETLVTLPSSWIPNIHWGYGFEGFESLKLYVMDRDEGRVFEVDTGVGGTETLYGNTLESAP